MKKLYFVFLAAAFIGTMNSAIASGGPDAYGYTWMTSLDPGGPAYNWIDITSRPGVQTVTGLADDNSAPGMINLGFSFHYYWNDYTLLKVGSNGWVSFNSTVTNIASCFPTIPSPGGPGDNYLAPLMGDLNFTGTGNPGSVRYWTNNVDTFIISYINVPFWSVSAPGWIGANNFQVILCGSDSSITYQYGLLSGFVGNAACVDLTVGIENSTGGIGLQVHSDVMPPNNYAIKFDYPTVVLLSIQDALPQWNIDSINAAEFIWINSAFDVSTDIRNAGNTGITSTIAVQTTIQNLAPATVFTGSATLPSLAAGDDSVITYTNQWTPNNAAQYSVQTVISCSQDINSANNVLDTEIDVVNPCVSSMLLTYNTTGVPDGSINWNGGANDDGVGVYFQPPVYPYTISSLQYYIATPGTNGFIAQIYDDNGPNNTAGTLLFTTNVLIGITTGWNTVTVTTPVTLTGGGFYVVWLQMGTTIFLGTETAGPRSHRNFEILDNSWSTFRYDDARDAMIRCTINGYPNTVTPTASIATNQLSISTTNLSTGPITGWLWDFGDMTTSTLQNPTHTYAAAGTYTVCLTASSPCGPQTTCYTVTVCQPTIASYSSSTAGLTSNFTDMTSGAPTTWAWDFGDATTSTQQNPSHTYAMGGTYNVCLIATNACGYADTVCQSVSVCGANTAAFTVSSNANTITFADGSTGAIDTWHWDFGETSSTSDTSNLQNPTYFYPVPGLYTICLIVANSCGNSDTICQNVVVCTQNIASFTFTGAEDSVVISNTSSGYLSTYFWDMGDGNNYTSFNPPTHYYATGGIYTICLYTGDYCGVVDTFCMQDTIIITDVPVNSAGVISVYPNPVNDVLTIELTQGSNVIEIYDIAGQLISTHRENGTIVQFDVNELAPGMYTLRIVNNNGSTQRRFIKE